MYLIRCLPKQCEYDTFHPPQNTSSFSKQLRYFHFFLEIVEHLPCIPVTCPLSSKLFVCWCIFSTWFHVLKNMCVCVFIDCTVSKHQLGCNMFLNDKCKFECFFMTFLHCITVWLEVWAYLHMYSKYGFKFTHFWMQIWILYFSVY